jgi:phage-related protein
MATVIQFPAQPPPRLKEIVRANGEGVITEWLLAHGDARARFRIRITNLRRVPPPWPKTQFRHLGDGIAEIKWKAGKKEFRAIGFDLDGYFLMVIGCTHKQSVYDPRDCLDTAKRRKNEVKRGEWRAINFEP